MRLASCVKRRIEPAQMMPYQLDGSGFVTLLEQIIDLRVIFINLCERCPGPQPDHAQSVNVGLVAGDGLKREPGVAGAADQMMKRVIKVMKIFHSHGLNTVLLPVEVFIKRRSVDFCSRCAADYIDLDGRADEPRIENVAAGNLPDTRRLLRANFQQSHIACLMILRLFGAEWNRCWRDTARVAGAGQSMRCQVLLAWKRLSVQLTDGGCFPSKSDWWLFRTSVTKSTNARTRAVRRISGWISTQNPSPFGAYC